MMTILIGARPWSLSSKTADDLEPLCRAVRLDALPLPLLSVDIRADRNGYATDYSASIASMLTSLIATCLHAGGNALEYLVALQEHRAGVFADPSAWLPWNDHANLVLPQSLSP